MRSQTELSPLQLRIVMLLANGMRLEEVANTVICSVSNVKQQLAAARRKTNARTVPQLVSVVIARGQLEWQEGQRVLTQAVPPQELQADGLADARAHNGARIA